MCKKQQNKTYSLKLSVYEYNKITRSEKCKLLNNIIKF